MHRHGGQGQNIDWIYILVRLLNLTTTEMSILSPIIIVLFSGKLGVLFNEGAMFSKGLFADRKLKWS